MAAVNVGTTSGVLVAADPDQHRKAVVVNLGPNPIYLAVDEAATTAAGVPVQAATGTGATQVGGVRELNLLPGQVVNAIAVTAAQTSPNNTRVLAS